MSARVPSGRVHLMTYVLQTGDAGADRLRLLARVKWPSTDALLHRVGLREGMRCLDVGCGIGEVSLELARRVGPRGQVVGIDAEEGFIARARQAALSRGLSAEFQIGRADTLTVHAPFDLVYARFLLSHLPDPAHAIARMAEATRSDGFVVIEDIDFAGHFCHPACPAFDRYVVLYQAVVRRNGGDPCIGPRLLELCLDAGLRDARMDLVQPTFSQGEGKRVAAVTMQQIGNAVVSAGLATMAEIDKVVTDLEAFAAADRSILSLPRIFQVWGRPR
ncbi:MAG: methyltransferase domain-containing protein [Gemmataceae bacterium]|nr:methyltransferase domain-containing protein [Gemmataceae bacterium]